MCNILDSALLEHIMPPPLFQKVKKYLSIMDIQKEIGFLHGILHCMKKNWESHGTISPINFGRELVISYYVNLIFVYKCDAISIFHSIFIIFCTNNTSCLQA